MANEAAMEITPFGEGAVRIALPAQVPRRRLLAVLRALPGVTDVVIAEAHACVAFDPVRPVPDVAAAMRALGTGPVDASAGLLHVVSVRYDGPDLDSLAQWAGLDREAVIARHLARTYDVRVVGFQPGFAYLGEVDPSIARPRLESPRVRVPKGSVGIAGGRTGIYPFASPGGWNLIGTAVDFSLFDPERGAVLQLGDRVRFERV
jgi:UPF0271 protein